MARRCAARVAKASCPLSPCRSARSIMPAVFDRWCCRPLCDSLETLRLLSVDILQGKDALQPCKKLRV